MLQIFNIVKGLLRYGVGDNGGYDFDSLCKYMVIVMMDVLKLGFVLIICSVIYIDIKMEIEGNLEWK